MEITNLVSIIKQSKKYKHISEEVIEQKIREYQRKNVRWSEHKEKFVLKGIKALLHKAYGSFQTYKKDKSEEYIEELKKNPSNKEILLKILKTNRSTKERLEIYSKLYKEIFKLTGKPRTILDLGAGLNPLSFNYMNLDKQNTFYHAFDISNYDSHLINSFFKMSNIKGEYQTLDLSKLDNVKLLPKADICFMFKLVDVLEKKGHRYSEEFVKLMIDKCKFLVISFATQTVGGKAMSYPHRGWIEKMLERIGFNFEILKFSNEIFYIVSKN